MADSVRSSRVVPVAVAVFAVGLLALIAIFVLFATGHHDLPLWLNTTAGAGVPLGLALALVGLYLQARRDGRTSHTRVAASQSANPSNPGSTTSAPADRS